MINTNPYLDELIKIRGSLHNNELEINDVEKKIISFRNELNNLLHSTSENTYSLIKSFFITFNIQNFSNITILFSTIKNKINILESAGDNDLIDIIQNYLSDQNINFYTQLEKIIIQGKSYKLFYENMMTERGNYTILSLTESIYFRASRFHILSDIIMDLIRAGDSGSKPVFNDIFENIIVEINRFIANFENVKPLIYMFKFEYIPDFFQNIGLPSVIELSDSIYRKLTEKFAGDYGIFRISLVKFLIITENNQISINNMERQIKNGKLNFLFKGIVLPYHITLIPFISGQTIYDLFEDLNRFDINDENYNLTI